MSLHDIDFSQDLQDVGGGAQLCRVANSQDRYFLMLQSAIDILLIFMIHDMNVHELSLEDW